MIRERAAGAPAKRAGLFHPINDETVKTIDAACFALKAHSFRHTYATLLHKAVQGDMSIPQRALGHTQVATTMIYDQCEGQLEVIDIAPYLLAAAGWNSARLSAVAQKPEG